jgi:rhodanese-related sulfurtransferase
MFQTIRRLIILSVLTLIAGFIVNQVYSDGIGWALLKPRLVSSDAQKQIRYISADSAFAIHLQGEAFFVDARPAEEYQIDHIPGAFSIPLFTYYKSPEILEQFDKETTYILYCFEPECREAGALAAEFVGKGFNHIFVLNGGYSEWLEKGYPVE